jgi:hypothetical protein
MTARSHETIRVGLRRIIREPNVSAKVRMQAIERLMYVEGLLDQNGHISLPKNQPGIWAISDANAKRIRELVAEEEGEKTG